MGFRMAMTGQPRFVGDSYKQIMLKSAVGGAASIAYILHSLTSASAKTELTGMDASIVQGSSRDPDWKTTARFVEEIQQNRPLCSDEYEIIFPAAPATLGIVLQEQGYAGE